MFLLSALCRSGSNHMPSSPGKVRQKSSLKVDFMNEERQSVRRFKPGFPSASYWDVITLNNIPLNSYLIFLQ
jgi:hypothetical protein